MGLVSKGKHKLTIELKPDTISAIDRQVRLFEDTKSRGSVIDELVSTVLEADTDAASEVYAFCLQRLIEENAKIASADPVSANAIRVKSAAFDALRKTFSKALIDDRHNLLEVGMDSNDSKTNEMRALKIVKLSDGVSEIVPRTTVLLNPSLEGNLAHLWGVWAYDIDSPCDLYGAIDGRCLGPLMAYLSYRDDLWKCGQHKLEHFIDEADAKDCMSQAAELQRLALDTLNKAEAIGDKTIVIAWAMLDMMSTGSMTHISTSSKLGPLDSVFARAYSSIYCGTSTVQDNLSRIFCGNADGIQLDARYDDEMPLVELASKQSIGLTLDLGKTYGMMMPIYHGRNCWDSVCNRLKYDIEKSEDEDMSAARIDLARARVLLDQLNNEKASPIAKEFFDIVLRNWWSLGNYTYTFRALMDIVDMTEGWPETAESREEFIAALVEISKGRVRND